jgi:hypothetical protein
MPPTVKAVASASHASNLCDRWLLNAWAGGKSEKLVPMRTDVM